MKLKTMFVSIVVSICLLSSCTNTNGSSDLSSARQWLDNLVCEFPCWQHITPLVTSFGDVTAILQEDKNIQIDFVGEEDISFQSINVTGTIDKTLDGKVKSTVLLVKGLILSDMLEVIGLPEDLALAKDLSTTHCLVSMRFPQKGAILDFYLENSADNIACQIDIKPESEIFRVVLGETNPAHNLVLDYFEWKGYGVYP